MTRESRDNGCAKLNVLNFGTDDRQYSHRIESTGRMFRQPIAGKAVVRRLLGMFLNRVY